MDSKNLIEASSEHNKSIQINCSILEGLAEGFAITGNEHVYDTLKNVSDSIRRSAKEMSDAVGEHLNTNFQESQKAVGETLKMCLR